MSEAPEGVRKEGVVDRPLPSKEYIGDSVYAEVEGGMVKIYTNNGFGPENVIYLEEEVYRALVEYGKRVFDR